jgi:hypothetical protein
MPEFCWSYLDGHKAWLRIREVSIAQSNAELLDFLRILYFLVHQRRIVPTIPSGRRLMSWIDRINAAIVWRIARKDGLLADEHGIEQSGQRYAYADLERAVAYRHPNHVGDDLAVALDFGESRIIVVTENDDAWTTVLAVLDKHPRNRRRLTEWRLALVVAAARERLELID